MDMHLRVSHIAKVLSYVNGIIAGVWVVLKSSLKPISDEHDGRRCTATMTLHATHYQAVCGGEWIPSIKVDNVGGQ